MGSPTDMAGPGWPDTPMYCNECRDAAEMGVLCPKHMAAVEARVSLDDALRVLADHAKGHRAEAERHRSTGHHQDSHLELLKAAAVDEAADSVRALGEGVSNG